jgi:hypothetical protein
MLLKLEYCIKHAPHKRFIFISDAEAIRNLLWQLTKNYSAHYAGTAIGDIEVSNLDGKVLTPEDVLAKPFTWATNLSSGSE